MALPTKVTPAKNPSEGTLLLPQTSLPSMRFEHLEKEEAFAPQEEQEEDSSSRFFTAEMPTPTVTVKRHPLIAIILFVAVAVLALDLWRGFGFISLYAYAVFAILGTKLFLSVLPAKKYPNAKKPVRTGVVITSYNEDPAYLGKLLDSLVAQDQQPVGVVVVDDHSTDLAAHHLAEEYGRKYPWIKAVRHEVNKGKREALATGFRLLEASVDVFMCVDSDTILEPHALSAGVRPFVDPEVTATTGTMLVDNYEKNILTRLIDVRFVNAFLGERAAYSQLGSVLCVCGALAFYRKDVIMRHLDSFLNQTFRGEKATVGDDRHLTNWCLTEGKVVYAAHSVGHTAVPEKLGHYVRQQARWGRSFFRESWWVMVNRRPNAVAWWLTLIELAQWFVFTSFVVAALIVTPIVTGQFLFVEYIFIIGLMAMARSVRYFDVKRHHQSTTSRWVSFITTPLYGYMNLFIMLPLRVWSLLTLKRTTWATRAKVEVTAEGSKTSVAQL